MKPSRLVTSGGVRRPTVRGMRKITKATLAGGAAAAVIAATVGVASPAQAHSGHRVEVDVSWSGTSCIYFHARSESNHYRTASGSQCAGSQSLFWTYYASPGEAIGIDPEMGGNSFVSCALYVDGRYVASDSAYANDGTEATCLTTL